MNQTTLKMYILLKSTSCLLMILKLRKPINKYFQNLESFEKLSVQVFWTSNLFFFLLQNIGFARWPDIILSQTLIYYWQEIFLLALTSDSEVILKWYHCIVFRLNRTMKCIVNLNMTCLVLFLFWFRLLMCTVWCCSIVCLRFQVVQIKRVDCKMSTKNVNNYE